MLFFCEYLLRRETNKKNVRETRATLGLKQQKRLRKYLKTESHRSERSEGRIKETRKVNESNICSFFFRCCFFFGLGRLSRRNSAACCASSSGRPTSPTLTTSSTTTTPPVPAVTWLFPGRWVRDRYRVVPSFFFTTERRPRYYWVEPSRIILPTSNPVPFSDVTESENKNRDCIGLVDRAIR